MVHSVKACAGYVAVLLLHIELLRVDFQLVSFPKSVCVCSAGSLSLGMALSSWCYRAFFAQERVGCCFIWVGCLVLERDVSCRVTLTCHSAKCEKGGDGHPGGLL